MRRGKRRPCFRLRLRLQSTCVLTCLSIKRPESAALDGRVADEVDTQQLRGGVKHACHTVTAQPTHQSTSCWSSPAFAVLDVVRRTLPQFRVVERTVGRSLDAEVDKLERYQRPCVTVRAHVAWLLRQLQVESRDHDHYSRSMRNILAF